MIDVQIAKLDIGIEGRQYLKTLISVIVTCTLAIIMAICCVLVLSSLFWGLCPWCGLYDKWVIIPSEIFQ